MNWIVLAVVADGCLTIFLVALKLERQFLGRGAECMRSRMGLQFQSLGCVTERRWQPGPRLWRQSESSQREPWSGCQGPGSALWMMNCCAFLSKFKKMILMATLSVAGVGWGWWWCWGDQEAGWAVRGERVDPAWEEVCRAGRRGGGSRWESLCTSGNSE